MGYAMALEYAVLIINISDPKWKRIYDVSSPMRFSPEQLPFRMIGVKDKTKVSNILDMVHKLIGNDKIKIMRILAHGNSGEMEFPGLEDVDNISNEWSRLQKYFAPLARLELHACGLASQTSILRADAHLSDANFYTTVRGTFTGNASGKGLIYLRKVARVFGVQVVAGVNMQGISESSWSFDGDTVTVQPNGKFHLDSEGTRIWDLEAQDRAAYQFLQRIEEKYIKAGDLNRARQLLNELIKIYPKSGAAGAARNRLKNANLDAFTYLPDGSPAA